jgi:adenosylcobinamide-GDP ribazoletransferase
LIGLLLVFVSYFMEGFVTAPVQAVLLVAVWTVVTGGLHLDGWADCCDSLTASVSPSERLAIMKDSRLGAFGGVGLFLILMVQITALMNPEFPRTMLLAAPVMGRLALVLAARQAPHRGKGMAAGFIKGLGSETVTWAVLIGGFIILLLGWRSVVAAVCALAAALVFRHIAHSRLGSVNGDVIGATCVIAESVMLVVGSLPGDSL